MEWLLAPIVIAALIAAAVTVWQTLYGAKKTPPPPPPGPQTSVTVNLGGVDNVPGGPPLQPGPGHVPTILQAGPSSPLAARLPAPSPPPPADPLAFTPVASSSRYEDLTDPASRQKALLSDLYRASQGGLRVEIPDSDADGVRDS